MRVQEARLADDRLGHARVAVPDDGHVVVGVEVPSALRIEEPDALAADDVHRLPVREAGERRAEHRLRLCAGAPRSARDPACAQLARHVVEAELVELLEERPRLVVPGLDVLGVLGIALHTPGADGDERRQPGEDEVAEEVELLVLERDPGLVAVDRDPRGAEDVLAADAEDRAEVDGQIPRPRAEAEVAEVGDPGDAAVLVDQDVVDREVAVHDLRREEVQARQHALLVAVEDALDDLPPASIGDRHRRAAEAAPPAPDSRGDRARPPDGRSRAAPG